ncbi:MAG: GyrI-like domain-containing protein [Chloroflexi bacterium]|nr:GyrI-like domain-containing protein [Chloroflexota bacterium]
MEKIDLKKELKHLYNPPQGKFSVVEVPPLNFLMLDGHGDPNTAPIYVEAVQALYSLAYTLKFAAKPLGVDFAVMPLEGLWWTANMADFSMERKDDWDWTMMIAQPEAVSVELVEQSRRDALRKKGIPALERVRFERFEEGKAAQIMYLGAYANEGPTIARMHEFIHAQGWSLRGKHHEIYLGDPRRNPPEKLKTIIRQPAG